MKKNFLLLALTFVMMFSLFNFMSTPVSEANETNVQTTTVWTNASLWAKPELEKAQDMIIIPDAFTGEDITTQITRAEFAAVAVLVYKNLTDIDLVPASPNPFTDTGDVDVLKAYNAGLMVGVAADRFNPDAILNREQMVTALTRVLKCAYIPGWTFETDNAYMLRFIQPAKFADDASISAWAKESVYFMAAENVVKGTGNNTFSPTLNATREQALIIGVRLVESFKSKFLDYMIRFRDFDIRDSAFTITGKAAAEIKTALQDILDTASFGDTVIVNGSKTDETAKIDLNIPAGITMVWQAESQDLSFDIGGGGTFEVAAGGTISVTETYCVAIYVNNSNVKVTGGKVSATGIYCTAIEAGTGNVTVSDGEVIADGGGMHGCYAIYLNNPGTVTVTGGTVAAVNAIANKFAITLGGGGLAAYLAGTCEGELAVYGSGIIAEVDSLDIPSSYGGTNNGLKQKAGSAITNVKWDFSGANAVISFNNGQYTVEWAAPDTGPPITPAGKPVRIKETGDLFNMLSEAIAAAESKGLNTFTLEIIGDVIEKNDVIITSNITIVGAEGAHIITVEHAQPYTSAKFAVQGGGSLTLGDGMTANPLTILYAVSVTDGTIHVKDGIILKSSGNAALVLNGSNVNGTINGGRIEATGTSAVALDMKNGAKLSEISGGVFVGRIDAVHLSDAGTKIDEISGGAFYQTGTYENTSLHGHAVFVQNESQIGEISGGYFEATANCALVVIRSGRVEKISGGDFVSTRVGTITNNNRTAAVWVEGETAVTGIGTISGGHFRGGYFGVLLIRRNTQAQIDAITGGTFEGTVALQNDIGGLITEISGGKFIGNQGILNVGQIKKISGATDILGKTSYGIYNYSGGQIDEISGGKIVSDKDHGIANSGKIDLISGGTIIGWYSAINCNGLNKGRLETISNGVFWGKNSTAINLAYEMKLEPGLSNIIGFGRYWGNNGIIFNSEDLVLYPTNTQTNDKYYMSNETKPVDGISEVEFKYLRSSDPPPTVILEISNVLKDDKGNVTGTGLDFLVMLYEKTESDSWDKIGDYTIPANMPGITILDLDDEKTYQITEKKIDGYKVIGFDVSVDYSVPETVPGAAVAIEVPSLPKEITINVVVNNEEATESEKPGSEGDPNPKPPVVVIPPPPQSPFISEHVAYIIGFPDGNVGPNRNITRAEVATIFFRLLTDEVRTHYWTEENPFPDVQKDTWYNNAISVMANMHVLQGHADGTFKPRAAITRAELASIAARFAKTMNMSSVNDVSFNDIKGHWAADDIIYAAEIGWVTGYSDGTFKPNQHITRAEVMALVNRMLERIPESADDLLSDEMNKWADNMDTEAWYYLAVQEATNSHVAEHKDKTVPGLRFEYEYWTEMMENRDWAQLEKDWISH